MQGYAGRSDVVVLGLPRGGVPVAAEVALALGAPLDAFVVRKLGVPDHAELAMGAIAAGGVVVMNPGVVASLAIPPAAVAEAVARETVEVDRRERLYRGARTPPDVGARTVIAVDDGLATGATMRAAVEALRAHRPRRVVVAVPVGAATTCRELRRLADEVVCVLSPDPFDAVGRWYVDFTPPTDDEVVRLTSGSGAGGATMLNQRRDVDGPDVFGRGG
ncbi:MAG: phosphoribosyltransferase [Actinomycetota bacterium]|nr:phosphoribosyltransferase [Actinomycetota bacterium]